MYKIKIYKNISFSHYIVFTSEIIQFYDTMAVDDRKT